MLSDGPSMCNVQGAHAADVPASTKPGFWKLAAPRMEVTRACNPPLAWRCICHWCNCASATLSGEHGPHQHWMTRIAVLKVVSAEDFAPGQPSQWLNFRCRRDPRVWKISPQYWPAAVAPVVVPLIPHDHSEEQDLVSHNRKLFATVFAVQKDKGCFHGCI